LERKGKWDAKGPVCNLGESEEPVLRREREEFGQGGGEKMHCDVVKREELVAQVKKQGLSEKITSEGKKRATALTN